MSKDKILKTWNICKDRVYCRSDYLRALIYRNKLRLQGVADVNKKPVLDNALV